MIKRSRGSLPVVFHVLNVLQQCLRLPCLVIDNRIAIVANDCYMRISVGSKMADADILSRVEVAGLTECEEQCSKNEHNCKAFTFGVGVKGNGSCEISTRVPMLENLETHPDYDVYLKKRQGSPWCDADRLYARGFVQENENRLTKSNKSKLVSHIRGFSKSSELPLSRGRYDSGSYGLVGIYDLFIDHDGRFLSGDDNHRVMDILANRNQKTASSSPFVTICHRKMQPGRKTMEMLVERVVNCENVYDCRRTCDYEKAFDCKGFNYRVGSSGSKGVCELTATPYFRMNVDRDFLTDPRYDYYERDRNCVPSLWDTTQWTNRGYGKNRQGPWPRVDRNGNEDPSPGLSVHPDIYQSRQEFSRFPDQYTRLNEQFSRDNSHETYNSRENGRPWNGPNWTSSEIHYSGSVYNNSLHDPRIDHKGFPNERSPIFPKYRPEDRSSSQDYDQFYGKYYNYGSAFGYNDNTVPPAKDFPYEEHGKFPGAQKCSIRSATGSKLSRSVLRKTCLARDLMQCEDLCIKELSFSCGSFAFRYNVLTTNPTDNCLLSDLPHQDLNFYTDLEPDRDYDTYVIVQDSKVCRLKKTSNKYSSEECFSRVRSGFGIPTDITKKSMPVDDLGECQFECTASQEFVCRSFVFKYATTDYRAHANDRVSSNCFLTDWPPGEINPANMPDMDGAELYERSSFSYGCEAYPPLPIPDAAVANNRATSTRMDEHCYSEHHRPCRLMPHAVVSFTRADTKSECQQKCSTMRNSVAAPPCMSFNYMIATDNTRNNCLLSDISIRDLRPNVDYTHDEDHLLYTWRDHDPYCRMMVNVPYATPSPEDHGPPFPPTQDDHSNGQTVFNDGPPTLDLPFDPTGSKFRPQDHERDPQTGIVDGDPHFDPGFDFFYPRKELSTFQCYMVNPVTYTWVTWQ
ncbi:uncharacterized protein LOC143349443 isoform X3 [Colletes latitarsis]|uniref:uncharacterized protein LOC143349443 isoform X3 n=1 Tax=Colletes latitarsis TaxID=2605962 RepID=UPI004036B5E5